MSDQPKNTDSIFWAALEIQLPHERSAYLDNACAGDEGLRAQVAELLEAYPKAQQFLEHPAATLDLPPLTERPGATIGRYKLLQEIGEGGFGVVYMAEQREPVRRKVALKIIKPGMDTRAVVARFESERQALAVMDHPNIAKVFDAGTTEESSRHTPCAVAVDGTRSVPTTLGRPYFVMELVHGLRLTEYCDQNDLTTRERLELFVQICHAVQHAHQKGIIHRDLKPSNVMVTLYDGVPVPKIIDFGVAKATGGQFTDKSALTGYGQMIGTPLYMSPEQAEMSGLDVDTRSDIYSLGVLLYELLTGSTPFDQERLREAGCDEIRRMIREDEPPRPSARISTLAAAATTISAHRQTDPVKLSRLLRHELDWIVMKALEKDRTRRYQTASDFGRDIERYLADEPVLACPPSAGYRLRKFARRNKGPVAAVSLVLLALIAAMIAITWGNVRTRQALAARDKVLSDLRSQEQETRRAEREKTEQLAFGHWNVARLRLQARRPGQRYASLESLSETVRHLHSLGQLDAHRLELRNDAIAALTACDLRPARRITPVPGCPQPWAAWQDPVGKYFASVDRPNVISWRRLEDDQVVRQWQWEGIRLQCLDGSPDGRYLAAFIADGGTHFNYSCRVWDTVTGSLVLERPDVTWDHAFRPDSSMLALVQTEGPIVLCDLGPGRGQSPFPVGLRPSFLQFDPSGKYLAVTSRDRENVDVWDVAARKVASSLVGPQYRGGSLGWSPDGSLLAVGSIVDNNIYVCTFPGGCVRTVLRGHEHVVTGVFCDPSGHLWASQSQDQTVRLWYGTSGGELVIPGEYSGSSLVFSPDGRRLLTASFWGGLTQWELVIPDNWLRFPPCGKTPTCPIREIAFSPDGRLLACTSGEGVTLWDAGTASLAGRVPSGDGGPLAFHPRDGRLLTAGKDGLVQWPMASHQEGRTLRVGPGTAVRPAVGDGDPLRISVSGAGDCLLLGASDGSVALMPLAASGGPRRLGTHQGLTAVALSRDGRWGVSVGRPYYVLRPDDAARIWDVRQRTLVRGLSLDGTDSALGAAFSPDGRWLVTAVNREFCFWEVGSWEPKTRLPRDPRSIFGLIAFARDGGLLALLQGRNRIELRDPATLRHLATMQTPGLANLTGLGLSADGTRVAASTDDNMLALWDLRRLRQQLTALELDWELPPYPPEEQPGEPVQPVTVNVVAELPSEAGTSKKTDLPQAKEGRKASVN